MDEAPVADLEAELGCFEPGLPDAVPRQGHGSSDTFFDAPTETTSHLEPPSKTKTVYPFGEDGTLGWTTPAGELLSVASSFDNRLVGIEYKKSIERGQRYYERDKMLRRVVNASQGSGYGIGLSLDMKIDPSDVFWIHNRWPRYSFQHDGLEIRLQYYIKSQSVIQQYQIRNNGQEDALLPYVITSDICFLEHQRPGGTAAFIAHPVPSTKCPERLLLIQNSEVLIRSSTYRAQLEMALFLNGERQSLWANKPPSESERDAVDSDDTENITGDLKEVEDTIRNSINAKKLLSTRDDYHLRYLYRRYYNRVLRQDQSLANKQNDFATYRNQIVVPGGSTQELTTVIQISGFTGSELAPKDPALSGNAKINQSFSSDDEDLTMGNIWDREERLAERANDFSLDKSDSRSKSQISEFVKDHTGLGKACSKIGWIGEARYHFLMAYLIAESFGKHNRHTWNNARIEYAEFLENNGWHRTALSIAKGLVPDLFGEGFGGEDITRLWIVIVNRVASILLKNRSFIEAEALYEKGLDNFSENSTELNTDSAHFLERVAVTQAYQEQNRNAHASYMRLLAQQSSARQTILSNLGFIERRLRQFSEAKIHYEWSLEASRSGTDDVLARSGLSTCLRKLDTDPEELADVWPSSIRYVDVNSALSLSPHLISPFREEAFSFAIARQLETLLSVCSIPLKGDQSSRGIAFMDADPLNCGYDGRIAYFQFRFLIQCQMYIRSMQKDENAKRHIQDRIHSVCEGHLVWVFQIADSTDTWSRYYAVSGSNTAEEFNSDSNPSLAYSVEGAFQFLKLWLYLSTWNEKWQFVVELLHLKLRDWLLYLERNQHMANLWIEDEDLESFKPYNSLSEDVSDIRRTYPHYHLSDAALIWLALLHIEKTIKLVEGTFHTQIPQNAGSIESMVKDIRQYFDASQSTLSLQHIRSSILKTFKVSTAGLNAPLSAGKRAGIGHIVTISADSETLGMQSSSTSALPGSQATEARSSVQAEAAKKRDQQLIVFQRTINQSMLEIESHDFATIEASVLGIFEGSQDHVEAAWRETLKIQKEKDISTFEDPRQIALAMFASRFKCNVASARGGEIEEVSRARLRGALYDSGLFAQKIVEDAPEPIRNWSAHTYETMSLLIGSLFKECRGIFLSHDRQQHAQPLPNALALLMTGSRPPTRIPTLMPGAVNPSSRMNQANVVDTDFLPDWMYHYPDFIHKKKLEIDVRGKLQQLSSVKSLDPAITRWKASENFNTGESWKIPIDPSVVDSGIKKPISPNQTLAEREISINDYYDRRDFWEELLQPRTLEKAKKRLVELSSQDKESVLICWLTTSEEEKSFFLEYFRRHESSESFFGERAHWQGNVWETEFHLGFHKLLSAESNDESTENSQSPDGHIYSQPVSSDRYQIKPVALSFRFVGDLRDQFWTCHFFSSVTDGFNGFIDEYSSKGTRNKLHAEKQGQRKVLEIAYVEKALGEMRRSIDRILAAFEKDLDAPEAKDPANESFVFIHDYSSLYLEIGGKLRNVSQQLDASLSTIEQWEKREETRGLRSRWSHKDEQRYGGKLRDLAIKCKFTVQQLRVQQGRLREQERIADQRHSNLVSYKQLQEARTSTQSAADVRLFTYVTIIFLPLSFSSSLFSMAGAPQGSTIYIMVPTTAVALMVTFLLLANLKLMDRHWSFWVNRMNARTRKKMKEQSQKWNDISRQLEETTQRRLIKSDFKKGLPAESNWWYVKFWLSYTVQRMRTHAHNGVRAWEAYDKLSISRPHKILAALFLTTICVLILIVYTAITMTVDTIHLQWIMARQLGTKMLSPESIDRPSEEDGAEPNPQKTDGAADGEDNVKSGSKKFGHLRTAITSLTTWLASSPRPIRDYIKKMDSVPTDPLERSGAVAEETASLDDEATGSQRNKARSLSLLAATTAFLARLLPKRRTASNKERDEVKDPAAANDEAAETGARNGAQPEEPESFPPQPRRKRKLLKKSGALGPETGEPRMWVGWSSV